jgi:integrase
MSRRGMIKKRCSSCGKRPGHRQCEHCGHDRFTWEFTVDVGLMGGKRKQVRRSGFSTKADAQAELVKIQASVDQGTFVESAKVSLASYLAAWLESQQAQLRPSTHHAYTAAITNHVCPHIGDGNLQSLTPGMLDRLYSYLLREGRQDGRGGLARKTVRNIHVMLHKALNDAVRKGLVARNVADASDAPRSTAMSGERETMTWTPAQLRAFLETVDGDRLYPLILLAATTGMRRGEVLGLRWQDLDLEAGRIAVRQTLINIGYSAQYSAPKTAKGRRSISLDARTVTVLRDWRMTQLQERMALGEAWVDNGLVFTRPDGNWIHPDLLSKRFNLLVRRSNLPRIRLHDLRHTHATHALEAGIHPKVVSERLGHATVAFTLDRYSHAIPALEESAAERVAELVFGAGGASL